MKRSLSMTTRGMIWTIGENDFWPETPMAGAAHYVSSDTPDAAPTFLVPDGQGDYREHAPMPRPKGRLGFR